MNQNKVILKYNTGEVFDKRDNIPITLSLSCYWMLKHISIELLFYSIRILETTTIWVFSKFTARIKEILIRSKINIKRIRRGN